MKTQNASTAPKPTPDFASGAGCVECLVRRPRTAQEWDDAADLFAEGASLAGMASRETHAEAAALYAIERMRCLAMFATGKAMRERERIKSPNK